jgi:hypothetical protein
VTPTCVTATDVADHQLKEHATDADVRHRDRRG